MAKGQMRGNKEAKKPKSAETRSGPKYPKYMAESVIGSPFPKGAKQPVGRK
jgi:hypothetical protein